MCSARLRADSGYSTHRQLFNHAVGTGEHRRRNCKAECFGGLEVDHQFELGRILYRELRWLRAFEDDRHSSPLVGIGRHSDAAAPGAGDEIRN